LKTAPLLPPADARDRLLIFVIAALCFLAGLTAVAALGANRAASGWQSHLRGSATVLVRPKTGETADGAAARAAEALSGVKGVVQAAALERQQAEALLKPWLGDQVLADLPVPRLVTLELDPKHPAKLGELDVALATAGIDATVDDHSLWTRDIVRAAWDARAAALAMAALLAGITASVIALATRATLTAQRPVVEVLHLSGAEDHFVAGLFQVRFAKLAAIGGVYGGAVVMVIAAVLRLTGGARGLTPALPIAWSDLLAPALLPVFAALIGAIAARAAALRLLKSLT
jgi:cell division transport system permease protein